MSRIIGDCIVAGGLVDEPERGTSEMVQCQIWPGAPRFDAPGEWWRDAKRARAIRCKWSGYMPRRAAECGAVKARAEVSGT